MERDLKYFDELWEASKPKDGMTHTRETWDRIAGSWSNYPGKVRAKMDGKVQAITEFLLGKGVLTEDTEVLDLGCGPGSYTMSFAKHAKSVTCSDVSPKMLEYSEENAKNLGLSNVEFKEADFLTQSVEELGWEKKFDLVFTSLTPAMDSLESIEKIERVSRKWAFDNSFVYLEDSLKNEVKENVFGMPVKNNQWGGSSPYCIWNILWLKGKYPEMSYYRESKTQEYGLNEKTAYDIAENIIRDRAPNDEEVARVFDYLKETRPEGKVVRKTNALYAWILWEV